MVDEKTLAGTPFDKDRLKKSVRKATRRLSQAHRNNEKDLFRFFVAKDAFESEVDPQVDIADLLISNEDLFRKFEMLELREQVIKIQAVLESNLRTIIGGARPGTEPTDVSVLAETPRYYVLYDKLEIIRESLSEENEVSYTVITAHRQRAKQILDRLKCDLPPTGAPVWVIQKPSHWYDGQWSAIQTLSHFIQCGMSPTEALDYWMVEIMNASVFHWAHVRGKSNKSIYNQLRKAKKKIDLQAHPETPSGYDFTERTYRSQKIDDMEYITVDNGPLHPRRDIMNPSLSGKMTSGYNGAGPKQLAVALLADSEGDEQAEQFASALHGQVQNLATTNEDGNWELSEEQLQRWYWSQ